MTDPADTIEVRPTGGFVLRTPALPFGTLTAWGGDHARPAADLRRDLARLVDDPVVREAVFVASPELATQIDAWRADPHAPGAPAVERALVRYLSRMAGRATPFGLFSGVSTGVLGLTTRLEVGDATTARRHTRLDNDYLFAACAALCNDPALRRELTFFPNSSLYRTAARHHYAEAQVDGGGRTYHLVAIEPTDYLDAVLERARAGATVAALCDVLCRDPDIATDEAEAFVGDLIDAQLLVPDLAPAVTGLEPIAPIIELLRALPSGRGYADVLADAQARIGAIDATPPGGPITPYREIAARLGAGIPAKAELARMFQVDLFKPAPQASLGPAVVAALTESLVLARTIGGGGGDDETWVKFRQAFAARYETREVPLLEVLDDEVGIGFGSAAPAGAAAPLLADLVFPGRAAERRVPWSRRDAHLLALVAQAMADGATELALSDRDVERLRRPPARLPDTFAVSATLCAASAEAVEAGRFQLRLGGADGGPGARLLGRFCHGSSDVAAIAAANIAAEHGLHPDAVFAEIVHLPEGRIGNILLRPLLRDHEIPYLGHSGARADRRIAVADLMVSIAGDRVVLRSRRLGREVVPRLSAAHNYNARSLGVYRFLCALGQQAGTGAGWSWGVLGDAPFLPRVRRGRIVLARARWLLGETDIAPIAAAGKSGPPADAVAALRARLRLPRWIVVVDGDHELPVDLDNALSVASFVHLIKGRRTVTLHELFPAPDELVATGPAGRFVHELIVPFARVAAPPRAAPTAPPIDAPAVVRRFPPGSSWLYLKLYTGVATADLVLREVVGPALDRLGADRLAARWFFIRYGDPDWHLRLRFAGDPATLMGEVLPRLQALIAPHLERGLIWRLQLDTYERELERYGGPRGIELAEQLFSADSDAVLAIVRASEGDQRAEARWRLTLRGIDRLLADLGFAMPERLALMTRARDTFGAEHGLDTALARALGDKFRRHRGDVDAMLAADATDDAHPFAPGLATFARRGDAVRPIAQALRAAAAEGVLTASLADLALSYVHMHVNRMASIEARSQELVLYDLLRRHYGGVVARARGSGSENR